MSRLLASVVEAGTGWMQPYRRRMTRTLVAEALTPPLEIAVGREILRFFCPTGRSLHDPGHLFTDEPETLAWIDSLPVGDTLWDIGANIGVFTLYAAKIRGLRVVAFEPSASSYAVLVKNIELNELADRVDAYCVALSDQTKLDHLYMANTGAGESMHAFGQAVTVRGEMKAIFRQSVPGFSGDDFGRIFGLTAPDHIKLDVDSIELAVLKGAAALIESRVKTIMVEIIDGKNGELIRNFLKTAGFVEDEQTGFSRESRNSLFRRASDI
jgi:FkbM family methyltransferase